MFGFGDSDGEELALRLLIGAFAGGIPLAVGLMRGHKQMAWSGFGVSILIGVGLGICAIVPAIIFTIIVAVTEPIEAGRKKKGVRRRRRRERADDLLDDTDEYNDRQRRRRRAQEEDDEDDPDALRPRQRRRYRDDDDDDDRPRRRRRRDDD